MASLPSRPLILFLTLVLVLVPVLPSHMYASIHEVCQFVRRIVFKSAIIQVSMLAGRPLLDPIMAYLEVVMSL